MKKIFNCIIIAIITVFTVQLVSCSDTVTEDDKSVMKKVIDKVLSNEGYYTGDVTKYSNEETYYTTNYFIFYSLFMESPKFLKYESELRGVEKSGNKYTACVVLNMEAQSAIDSHGGVEEEPHNDSAVGEDVPVEVVLKKKNDSFYIISSKEYENLELAIKSNENFKE